LNQFAMPTVHTASINSHINITSQLQLVSVQQIGGEKLCSNFVAAVEWPQKIDGN